MITDILFTLAALGFTYSAVPQILKLRRTKNSIGLSLTRNKIILVCIILTIIACVMSELLLSTIMNCIQLVFVIVVIYQIKKYRRQK